MQSYMIIEPYCRSLIESFNKEPCKGNPTLIIKAPIQSLLGFGVKIDALSGAEQIELRSSAASRCRRPSLVFRLRLCVGFGYRVWSPRIAS